MQQPGIYHLMLYRGDSAGWQFRLWQDTVDGTPADLTNATARAEIRDTTARLILAPSCVITLPNIVTMRIDSTDWMTTVPPSGVWDLQVTFPYTPVEVHTVLRGSVSIRSDVTLN